MSLEFVQKYVDEKILDCYSSKPMYHSHLYVQTYNFFDYSHTNLELHKNFKRCPVLRMGGFVTGSVRQCVLVKSFCG